jgi:hypothetical protein
MSSNIFPEAPRVKPGTPRVKFSLNALTLTCESFVSVTVLLTTGTTSVLPLKCAKY